MKSRRDRSLGEVLAAAVPPEIYFRCARWMLNSARGLFRAGAIGAIGIRAALGASDYLARAGHASWWARRALRRR